MNEHFIDSVDLYEKNDSNHSSHTDCPVIIIFIGLQGCGKTHYFNTHLSDRFAHVNLDTLHTRNKEMIYLQQLISERKNIVVDNTNPQIEDRARYIQLVSAAGYYIVGYYFGSRLQDCIIRNNMRTGKAKVPAKAIAATSNRFQLPSKDEGFDELYYLERIDEDTIIKKPWRD